MNLQFVKDDRENIIAVQIPIDGWKRIKRKYPDIVNLLKPSLWEIFMQVRNNYFRAIQNMSEEEMMRRLAKKFR